MAKRSKVKGWDGTPPQHTYPYAVHTVNHLWGEPGVMVAPSRGEHVTCDWSWSQPTRVIVFRELVKAGTWRPHVPGGTPSVYREVHRIAVPDEIVAGAQDVAYRWVHEHITAWVRETYGADVFDESRRG